MRYYGGMTRLNTLSLPFLLLPALVLLGCSSLPTAMPEPTSTSRPRPMSEPFPTLPVPIEWRLAIARADSANADRSALLEKLRLMTKLVEIQDSRQCRQAFEPTQRIIEALEEGQTLRREMRDYMVYVAAKQPDEELLELFVENIEVTEDLVATTEADLEELWKNGEDARCFPVDRP